jgi:hypothetical protein
MSAELKRLAARMAQALVVNGLDFEQCKEELHAAIDRLFSPSTRYSPGVEYINGNLPSAGMFPDEHGEWVRAHTAEPPINAAPACQSCGEPQSKNPHPKAGDPSLEFGYEWHCIPCLVRTRSNAIRRALEAEKALRELRDAAAPNEPVAPLPSAEVPVLHIEPCALCEGSKCTTNCDHDELIRQSADAHKLLDKLGIERDCNDDWAPTPWTLYARIELLSWRRAERASPQAVAPAKEIAEAVLVHCYGQHGVDDRMIEQTAVVVAKTLSRGRKDA